jgi:hypothetical protein
LYHYLSFPEHELYPLEKTHYNVNVAMVTLILYSFKNNIGEDIALVTIAT